MYEDRLVQRGKWKHELQGNSYNVGFIVFGSLRISGVVVFRG